MPMPRDGAAVRPVRYGATATGAADHWHWRPPVGRHRQSASRCSATGATTARTGTTTAGTSRRRRLRPRRTPRGRRGRPPRRCRVRVARQQIALRSRPPDANARAHAQSRSPVAAGPRCKPRYSDPRPSWRLSSRTPPSYAYKCSSRTRGDRTYHGGRPCKHPLAAGPDGLVVETDGKTGSNGAGGGLSGPRHKRWPIPGLATTDTHWPRPASPRTTLTETART